MPRIHLCFVWHMHQPFYKDLISGEYRLPWTRYHALKDYYGMVKVLEDFPAVHQTFNLVPSMIVQIEEYASGLATDPFLECAVKPALELSGVEQQFMLKYFFQVNPGRMIYRYPRYGELYDAFQQSGADPQRARRLFTFQDLRDLQVLSQLAWFDEEFQENDPEVHALIAKERRYTLEDQALMAQKQQEILGKVVPVYREFAARGQIEISTTPFYHPILPLICDSDIASVSHPHVRLPSLFRYPQDARHQLRTAREFIEREFGRAPAGLWPSEGSVSDEALSIAAETGFEWAASDNGVLARTLHQDAGAELTYRSYLWTQGERQLRMIFRDHFLSDEVGFVYSKMGAGEAAEQFLEKIRANAHPLVKHGQDVLVPIILDGENAWEYYDRNGRPFLRELYSRISNSGDLDALTVSEALKIDEPRPLDHIFPGSWIDANFDVWIGSEEDNTAWEYLLRARQKFDEAAARVPEEGRQLAFEELMIAEGSDWCWWYGPEHQSENRPEFDDLYRQHLRNVYHALNLPAPDELSRPILMTQQGYFHEAPANAIHAVIDGEVSSYFEWAGAGHYRSDLRSGAMHGSRNIVQELHYGADEAYFYVRLDFDGLAESDQIELRTKDKSIPLINNPAVESAQRKILEARVPFELLGSSKDQPLSFQVALLRDNVPVETIPPEGWIEVTNFNT